MEWERWQCDLLHCLHIPSEAISAELHFSYRCAVWRVILRLIHLCDPLMPQLVLYTPAGQHLHQVVKPLEYLESWLYRVVLGCERRGIMRWEVLLQNALVLIGLWGAVDLIGSVQGVTSKGMVHCRSGAVGFRSGLQGGWKGKLKQGQVVYWEICMKRDGDHVQMVARW